MDKVIPIFGTLPRYILKWGDSDHGRVLLHDFLKDISQLCQDNNLDRVLYDEILWPHENDFYKDVYMIYKRGNDRMDIKAASVNTGRITIDDNLTEYAGWLLLDTRSEALKNDVEQLYKSKYHYEDIKAIRELNSMILYLSTT